MLMKDLIGQSALYMVDDTRRLEKPLSLSVFRQGGEWMRVWLEAWDQENNRSLERAINFTGYGLLKYLICIGALLASAYGFYEIDPWLLPFSLIAFYIVEVHFLFLFPLLIDGVKHPVWQSIVITHRIGLFRVLAKVIPIGLFMMLGLLHVSDPFRNWYKGCLAVLIWYQQDVRNRI